ncbi:Poly(U)-specific endoribonuclease [Strongyloides ratti]|uniref:Endoribonuclease n=1 Tax=Strongyloides ratti TaxID=34506 RepID=A0A090KWD8_STRRB|nr:Poly(U)-specific endoribonuclease [Strongyloides ratti]CEF61815.1 Poly(U)-specific endoribonuclease [Strongyloides ratti]
MLKIFLSTIFFGIFFLFSKEESIPNISVRNNEIIDLVNKFYDSDINAPTGESIVLNYQGHTALRNVNDVAPLPLFTKVDTSIKRKPTFNAYFALMDNYIENVGVRESITTEETNEIDNFLNLVMNTTIGIEFYNFLKLKKHPFVNSDRIYKNWLKQLWFGTYSRAKGVPDTSGFEHVFMGEIKNDEISGLHNWYRFYYLESQGQKQSFDYKGYIIKRFKTMASVKYSWKGYFKKGGSFFIGTSPEYDFFVYTLCFLFRRGNNGCGIEVNGCTASITSYEIHQNNKIYIGTLFPNIGPLNERCRRFNSR